MKAVACEFGSDSNAIEVCRQAVTYTCLGLLIGVFCRMNEAEKGLEFRPNLKSGSFSAGIRSLLQRHFTQPNAQNAI